MDDRRELLVCARYEFRRGEQIEKAYENFCDVVGNDAMAYRDFEFCWYRFREGNFDLDYDRSRDPSKELGDMPLDISFENLNFKERHSRMDDPRELLVCARYEFRRGEPIEKAYENFCDVVGNDAMAYRDFEFWWYRFKEGNFDLDYDRIKNPSKELGDMPVDIMEEIFEYLELKERAICRKVSRNIRNLIDDMKFTIQDISVFSYGHSINLVFNFKIYIKYEKTDNGCRIECGEKSKIINGADFRQIAYADLRAMLNNPKLQIGTLIVEMMKSSVLDAASISTFLSSLSHQLNVKCFLLSPKCQEEVMAILPYLKPRVLEKIELWHDFFDLNEDPQLEIDQVFDLDQWKQAKTLDSDFFFPNCEIENFFHFNKIDVYIDAISKQDVIRLKNTILASPHFESCRLKVEPDYLQNVTAIFNERNLPIPGSTSVIVVDYEIYNTLVLVKRS